MSAPYPRLLLAGIALALGACGAEQSGTTTSGDGTPAASALTPALTSPAVATINSTTIDRQTFEDQVRMRLTRQPNVADSAEVRKAILEELISMEVVVQDAVAKGMDKNPELALTLETQRRALIANAAIQHYAQSNPVSDADLKKLYDEQFAKGSKEYRASHILVKTEDEAKAIIAALDKGGDFAKLAKEKSGDAGSATKGGDLDWFAPNAMVKPFSDAAATLAKGTYTKTPVKTQFGYHVIKLDDSRDATPPSFDEVKERLRNQRQSQVIRDYIDKLRAQAKIEMKEIPAPPAPVPAAPAAPAEPAASAAPAPEPAKP
jgi:peptidyl-prolyl cis-trans isomerase C